MQFSRYNLLFDSFAVSGDKGIRTLDPLLARQVLSQLSYTPEPDSKNIRISGLKRAFPLLREVMAANPNGLKWTRTTDLTLIRRAL